LFCHDRKDFSHPFVFRTVHCPSFAPSFFSWRWRNAPFFAKTRLPPARGRFCRDNIPALMVVTSFRSLPVKPFRHGVPQVQRLIFLPWQHRFGFPHLFLFCCKVIRSSFGWKAREPPFLKCGCWRRTYPLYRLMSAHPWFYPPMFRLTSSSSPPS